MMSGIDEHGLRRLRQFVRTQALLGVDVVPVGAARGPVQVDVQADVELSRERDLFGKAVPPSPPTAHAAPIHLDVLTHDEKTHRLHQLDEQQVRGCTNCALHEQRTQTVFGVGSVDAQIMFIGEGPGADEDRVGEPFVGKAGELLTKQIGAMGLTRDDVYIANIVKCRPPGNRTPTPDEAAACEDYLKRQIAIVRPKVIVAVGAVAARSLLATRMGITALRGKWGVYTGLAQVGLEVPVMPTFHPSFLLRQYTVANRKAVWSDLQQVMDRVGLPGRE